MWPLIKISLYIATLLQELFQNFGLIKFNLTKVSQYKVTLMNKIIYLQRIFLCLQSNANGSFMQKFINFVEQRVKFSHFEGNIMP